MNYFKSYFEKGTHVRIKTFYGGSEAPSNTEDEFNYWTLIGLTGIILEKRNQLLPDFFEPKEQALIQFDDDIILKHGLHCHNTLSNSLWILITDLEGIE